MPCCFTPNPDPLAPQPTHTVIDCCTLKIHLTDDSAVQTFNLLSLDYEINAGTIFIKDGVNLRSVPLDAAYIIFGVADQAALTTLLDEYVAACKCDPPIVITPETIDTLNCDNTTTPVTFDAPLQRVVIVQDKPFVVCKSNIDFEIGCSSIDGRTIVRTYVQNEDGTITSAIFEQDGITLITDGSILVKCEKDYEDVELCHQDITDNSIKYRQVIIYDTETNISVSEIWLNSLGAIISAPTNIEACSEVEEIDKVVTNWLPICVDGVQWYVAEQILFNNATQTEVLTKIYKQGANGAIVNVAPIGTITEGYCNCKKILYNDNAPIPGLYNKEWDTGQPVTPGSAVDVPYSENFINTFNFSSTPLISNVVNANAFLANDTNNAVGVQDIQFRYGYIIIDTPIYVRWSSISEGYIQVKLGLNNTSPSTVISVDRTGTTIGFTPSVLLPVGTHRIEIYNFDNGGTGSVWSPQVSIDNISFSSFANYFDDKSFLDLAVPQCVEGWDCNGTYYNIDKTQVLIDPVLCDTEKELDVIVSNWLPLCVDGVQWYARESQVIDNSIGGVTITSKEYKRGADGSVVATAPVGVIVEGECILPKVAQVPNCAGTLDDKPVDSITGTYILNHEHRNTTVWHDEVPQTGEVEVPATLIPNPSYAGNLLSYGITYTQAQTNANNLLIGGSWNIPAGDLGLAQAQWASFDVQIPYIPECATNVRIKATADYSATLVSGAPNGLGDGDAYMMLAATNTSPIVYPSNLLMGWDYDSASNTATIYGSSILPIPPASTSVKIVMWGEQSSASSNPIFDNTFSSAFSNLQVSILYDIDGCPSCIDVIRVDDECGISWTDVNGNPHTPNNPQQGSCPSAQKVAEIPNCIGTLEDKPVDSVVAAYLINQENKHTELVYDSILAVIGGTITYTYTAPHNIRLSHLGVTVTNDTLLLVWTDFGDGYSDVGLNPNHTYNSDGVYEIKSYLMLNSRTKILIAAKEVNILNGLVTYSGVAGSQAVNRNYSYSVSSAFQDFCGNLPIGAPYTATGSAYVAVGTLTAFNRPILDELEDNADYQATIATPAPLQLQSGGVSIASGTLAATLGPDGTIWNNPGNLRSVTIRARRSNTTNAVPGAGPNQVMIITSNNKVVLLTGESVTYSVEDGNIQDFASVECLANSAALVIYNFI